MKVYHQIGHNYKWNYQSYQTDRAGDGLILAPRFIPKADIERLPAQYKETWLFDPQFFKPNIPKGELDTYNFFPDIFADGFKTTSYVDNSADIAASNCVKWQIENSFSHIVIPNRYEAGMPSDYIQRQEELFVSPFLEAIKDIKSDHPVLLQLVLNEHMLLDEEFIKSILNWLTGRKGLSGIYLIVEVQKRGKQITQIKLLTSLLRFIDILRSNEMEVIIGYTNTEAILLSLANPTAVSMGSYEATRMFHIRNFEETKSKPASPNARIYTSKLLHWVNQNYVEEINKKHGGPGSYFDQTKYHAEMFQPTYRWHFTKSELYKHYFLIFNEQCRAISPLSGKERWLHVRKLLLDAREAHSELEESGIYLDPDSNPSHIGPWLTASSEFASTKGWL